jgi:phosphoribosyl 1,2-cyclic phosphodiesterase
MPTQCASDQQGLQASMKVRLWGVRGSIAVPGPSTSLIGGNTSCVSVEIGDERIIFDAGTGIRALGEQIMKEQGQHARIYFSHLHWDHIQGLPFFTPAYVPGFHLMLAGGMHDGAALRAAMHAQMQPPGFPVAFSDLRANIQTRTLQLGVIDVLENGATIKHLPVKHPGGSYAYRVEFGGRSFVYATDVEHEGVECTEPNPDLVAFCRRVDVLVYDAQYTPEEYDGRTGRPRVGWGHSTYEAAARLASAANVGELSLFHHDPARNDVEVLAIESRAQALFPRTHAAREGQEWILTPRAFGARARVS